MNFSFLSESSENSCLFTFNEKKLDKILGGSK